MNLEIIAKVCEEVYHNGRPKANRTLKNTDLLQIAIMAKGFVVTGKFWAQGTMEDMAELYPSMLKRVQAQVVRDKSRRPYACIPEPIVDLPKGYGLYTVEPSEEASEKELLPYFRGRVGDSWLYTDSSGAEEDFGVVTYEVIGSKIYFNGIPSCAKMVDLVIIPASFDKKEEVPLDISFEVMNHVLGTVLGVKGFPVNMKDNNDPNVSLINSKIAEVEK